jgi:hypothetical protein
MNPIDYRDREARFQDACKFAAAVVVVGLIVFAGESFMHGTREAPPAPPVVQGEASFEYFPDRYPLQSAEPEPHVEAF